eukprot:GHVT01025778.1.p1 GENE.GHVT01025778.1~~GHVT01025778.1.p1  ORF type:complete len:216 (-),score=0.29 GHVT01025778.1:358-1005(-)
MVALLNTSNKQTTIIPNTEALKKRASKIKEMLTDNDLLSVPPSLWTQLFWGADHPDTLLRLHMIDTLLAHGRYPAELSEPWESIESFLGEENDDDLTGYIEFGAKLAQLDNSNYLVVQNENKGLILHTEVDKDNSYIRNLIVTSATNSNIANLFTCKNIYNVEQLSMLHASYYFSNPVLHNKYATNHTSPNYIPSLFVYDISFGFEVNTEGECLA